MSLRTPLGRVRGLGSAKSGTHHFWVQRVTAVALIPLVLWFVFVVMTHTGADYATMKAWLGSPVNTVLMIALVVATFHHMQLGLQVVIEDYVHSEGTKLITLLVMKGASFLLAVAAIVAVLKVAFGGM